ncbi:MAG: permease-like cell division protein FtsX [Lachnospiraceae bacterium]|nr:permease-like cell division protein FtsX [Lachnospiraceae bacterium]MDD3615266.1 permease-like cell division protein FtsX [Lachnospiraceae bacterium]
MRISTIGYTIKQGFKNIWTNKMFSLASIATMGACIFLFGLIFSVFVNFQYIVRTAEEGVAITVFFTDDADQARIDEIGNEIRGRSEVTQCNFVSAEDAWNSFKEDYFEGDASVAEGFQNDNPLANSANYEVFVDKVESQGELVSYIESLEGVRKVNQSEAATKTLSTVNRLIAYVSVVIIGILLIVAVFLISNTVSMGIAIRKEEIGIMKLIGATDFFVRSPFLIEGVIIGLIGSAIPLGALYFMYNKVIQYVLEKFHMLNSLIQFLPVKQVFESLLPIGLVLGMGIGLVGSVITIHKHLRV